MKVSDRAALAAVLKHEYESTKRVTERQLARKYHLEVGLVTRLLKEAGVTPRIDAMVQAYAEPGASHATVARQFGYSEQTVRRLLKQAGVPRKTPAQAAVLPPEKEEALMKKRQAMAKLYNDGASLHTVAAEFGTSTSEVVRHLDAIGVKRRHRSQRSTLPGRKPSPASEKKAARIPPLYGWDPAEFAKRYLDGADEVELAATFNITVADVGRELRALDLPYRGLCRHGDADSSPGYEVAVKEVAARLYVDVDELRSLLVRFGIRGYARPRGRA